MTWVNDTLNSALGSVWANVVYYTTLQFVDPFWWWCGALVALYAAVTVICYFFGTYWPVLRVIGGFLLMAATFGLFAYAKGEKDARAKDKKKPRRK